MDDTTRFHRAMEIPDGLVTDEAKLRYAGRRLLEASTYVEDNEELAERTAAVCLEFVRDLYVSGRLDEFLLEHGSLEAHVTRIAAELDGGHLREQLSRTGAIVQPTKGVAESVVTKCLSRLGAYVEANPIDPT